MILKYFLEGKEEYGRRRGEGVFGPKMVENEEAAEEADNIHTLKTHRKARLSYVFSFKLSS
jgi:hypothetical protein